jgi:hypothetical protein
MNHKRKIVLGLVPTRRDVSGEFFCSIEVALNRKRAVEKKLKDMKIDFINIDFLNEEGLIRKGLDAQKIVDHFNSKGVDAIFCPFVNFGTEDAIAKIGKLWENRYCFGDRGMMLRMQTETAAQIRNAVFSLLEKCFGSLVCHLPT